MQWGSIAPPPPLIAPRWGGIFVISWRGGVLPVLGGFSFATGGGFTLLTREPMSSTGEGGGGHGGRVQPYIASLSTKAWSCSHRALPLGHFGFFEPQRRKPA